MNIRYDTHMRRINLRPGNVNYIMDGVNRNIQTTLTLVNKTLTARYTGKFWLVLVMYHSHGDIMNQLTDLPHQTYIHSIIFL